MGGASIALRRLAPQPIVMTKTSTTHRMRTFLRIFHLADLCQVNIQIERRAPVIIATIALQLGCSSQKKAMGLGKLRLLPTMSPVRAQDS